jgi:hypothetical protein
MVGRPLAGALAPALALALAGGACRGAPDAAVQPLPAVDEVAPWIASTEPPSPVASYRIAARLDPAARRISGQQTLTWVNTGATAVHELPLHLYMNAFKNEASVFMRESRGQHRGARAAPDGWGWIDLQAASVAGGPDLAPRLRFPGPDETVVEVPLDRPVEPGETVEVAMSFEVQLPVAFARTGTVGAFIMVGQWFPKIGVRVGPRGQETWHAEPLHLDSEFFADFGDYHVELTVPDTHVVAATGVLTGVRDEPGQTRTLTYRAQAVHDFAWMADPFMTSIAATADTGDGNVEVRVFFREPQRGFAERHLAAGVAAVEAFSRMLLPYPWARMTIVAPPPEAMASTGGMEYPTLVTTSGDSVLSPQGVRIPEFVTIHEVAHNWFQGILASNEVDEPWLDEGLTDFVSGVLMRQLYGRDTSLVDWGPVYGGLAALRAALAAPWRGYPDSIATRSHAFADSRSYGAVVYSKTAAMLETLEGVVGSDRLLAALGAYAREMAFGHPTESDLVRVLERELGEDLGWYLRPALHELGAADLGVRSIDCQRAREPSGVFGRGAGRKLVRGQVAEGAGHRCKVIVENLGRVPVPVDVSLTLADGRSQRHRWDDRGQGPSWYAIEIEESSPVVEVVIDPDRLVSLDDGGLRRSLRVEPDRSASRRAAARGQFWTQTAMQVLGL